MKEIKFRFWNVKSNSMNSWQVMKDDVDLGTILSGDCLEKFISMQYTGLKDKEGVEIYSGDIIKDCEGSTRTIIWERNGFKTLYEFIRSYEGERYKSSSVGELRETSDRRWGYKIIGNIYESPELLELEI